jgi:putative ABC transport system permease protein
MPISLESIRYSLRNLKHKRLRSSLTIVSIFMGITAIFVFISFGLGLFAYIQEFTTQGTIDKIAIMPKGVGPPGLDDTFKLTEDDVDVIEKASGIYEATGIYVKPAEVKQRSLNKFVFLMGYDPDVPLILEFFGDIGIEQGRLLRPGEKGNVVLGYNYLIEDKIFPKAFELNDKIEVQGQDLKVIGFFEKIGNPQDDSNVYVSSDFAPELYPDEELSFGWIVARAELESMDQAIKNVEDKLRDSRGIEEGKEDFFVQSYQDLLSAYTNVLNVIVGFVILIALISVIVSAINTANTMVTSVLERVKEVGIIKSIGAKNSEIFKIFLFESAFLGFVAGSLGVLIGWILVSIAGAALDSAGLGFLTPIYPWTLILGCIFFATLTGAISGAIPAYQASKIKPVDALRYE